MTLFKQIVLFGLWLFIVGPIQAGQPKDTITPSLVDLHYEQLDSNYTTRKKAPGVSFCVGSGLLELSHIGVGILGSQFELRTSVGYGFQEKVTSISLDGHYHFAIPQKYSQRRKLFAGIGGSYLVAADNISYDDAGIALRFYTGAEFYLNKFIGIQFDIGVSLNSPMPIEHVETEGVSPSASIRCFVHFMHL